ncbi:MAG: VWA domain-containing protein, partial [Dehalococcoidia bacterium]|nr:VWA domain-containing protein [Dehalococcoidia bacterium]
MPDPARRVSAGAVALALAALLGTIAATAGPAPRASAQTGCSATIDLVVVLDGSESIAPDDFELMRSFAGQLISHFTLDPEYALAGLVQFSGEGEGRVESQLTDDGPTILGSVAAMPQIAGARDIQEGIAYGQGEIKIGGRPGARGALVMLTDGAHNQPGDPAGEAEA